MSDDLQSLGVEALRGLLDNLTSTKAFALSQAPEVCQQLVLREITLSIAGVCLGIIAIAFLPYGMRTLARGTERISPADMVGEGIQFRGGLIIVASLLVGGAFLCVNCYNLLSVLVAPKVYLLETIAYMVRH